MQDHKKRRILLFFFFLLKALVEQSSHNVCTVVTQPDKPKGRGYALLPPPVKIYAKEKGILNAFVNAMGYTLEEWLSFDEKK